ncbi:MAG: FAD-binding oxidoreductase [Prochloraceae cyanobacterium]
MIAELENIVRSESDVIKWEDAAQNWQEKINRAIASKNPPDYLIYPHDSETLSKIIKYASTHELTIMPCGSGSKISWGGLKKDIRLLLSTKKLDRIVEHAVDDLTVTVAAGVKLSNLQNILKDKNQFLALDPAYPENATIGGIIATADSGSWRSRYGGVRDMLLGISFLRPDGAVAKAGGRVVKNVAGYDLMKLFAGSYGTLGIITEATFRLYPLPESSITILLSGENEAIATATQTLLNSTLTPTAADLLSPGLVKALEIGTENASLIVRFQSIAESCAEQTKILESIAKNLNLKTILYRDSEEEKLWQRLQKIIRVPVSKSAITCKIGVIPNAAVETLNKLTTLTNNSGLGLIRASSGLGWLNLDSDLDPIK